MRPFITLIFLLLSAFTFAQDPLYRCVEEICGTPENHEDMEELLLRVKNERTAEQALFMERFANLVKNQQEHIHKQELLSIKALRELDINFINSLDPIDKHMVLFLQKVIPAMVELAVKNKLSVWVSIFSVVDEDFTTLFIEKKSSSEEAKWLNDFIGEIRNDVRLQKIFSLIFFPYPIFSMSGYLDTPNSPTFYSTQHALSDVLVGLEQNHEPSLLIEEIIKKSVTRVVESKDLDANKIEETNTIFAINELVKHLRTSSHQKLKNLFEKAPESFFKSIIETNSLSVKESSFLTSLSQAEIEKRYLLAMNVCEKSLAETSNQLPSMKEIENFRQYVMRAKLKAAEFTKRKISATFAKKVLTKFEKLQYDLPLNRENFEEEIINDLSASWSSNSSLESLKYSHLTHSTNEKEFLDDILNESTYFPFSHIVTLCNESYRQDFFSDKSVSDKHFKLPALFISWSTLKNLSAYKGVISHEMGHQLYAMIRGSSEKEDRHSKKSFNNLKEVLNCVADLHGKKDTTYESVDESGGPVQLIESLYTSEDFADQFSAFVERGETINMGCLFILEKENLYSDLSLINNIDQDPHSSGAYRVINIEAVKSKILPQSCSEALFAAELQIKSCMD